MAEPRTPTSLPPYEIPKHIVSPPLSPPPSPPPPPQPQPLFSSPKRPSLRVTSEFNNVHSIFFHKISTKLFDSLAKFSFSFKNSSKGEISQPRLAFISKHLSMDYDFKLQNAILKTSFYVGPGLRFDADYNVKAQRVEVGMDADLAGTGYALEFWSPIPFVGLPKATFRCPIGQISLKKKKVNEEKKILPVYASAEGQIWKGICTAEFMKNKLKLRYHYKDDEMSLSPIISLPSNELTFAFKRRFSPFDKLSYWYNFDSKIWSMVYKHTYGKDFKFKAGYLSKLRLGWAALYIGDEKGKAKPAPMKMKLHIVLHVPQDDNKSSAIKFSVKKRWDI